MRTYYNEIDYTDQDIAVRVRRYLNEDWEFTNNIRYVKRSIETDVELELQIKLITTSRWWATFGRLSVTTMWVNERYFFVEDQIPDTLKIGVSYEKCN